MAEAEAWAMIPKLDKDKTGCVLEMYPIVLCKDCKHSCGRGRGMYCQFIECGKTGAFHKEDWFCADGEEREAE